MAHDAPDIGISVAEVPFPCGEGDVVAGALEGDQVTQAGSIGDDVEIDVDLVDIPGMYGGVGTAVGIGCHQHHVVVSLQGKGVGNILPVGKVAVVEVPGPVNDGSARSVDSIKVHRFQGTVGVVGGHREVAGRQGVYHHLLHGGIRTGVLVEDVEIHIVGSGGGIGMAYADTGILGRSVAEVPDIVNHGSCRGIGGIIEGHQGVEADRIIGGNGESGIRQGMHFHHAGNGIHAVGIVGHDELHIIEAGSAVGVGEGRPGGRIPVAQVPLPVDDVGGAGIGKYNVFAHADRIFGDIGKACFGPVEHRQDHGGSIVDTGSFSVYHQGHENIAQFSRGRGINRPQEGGIVKTSEASVPQQGVTAGSIGRRSRCGKIKIMVLAYHLIGAGIGQGNSPDRMFQDGVLVTDAERYGEDAGVGIHMGHVAPGVVGRSVAEIPYPVVIGNGIALSVKIDRIVLAGGVGQMGEVKVGIGDHPGMGDRIHTALVADHRQGNIVCVGSGKGMGNDLS